MRQVPLLSRHLAVLLQRPQRHLLMESRKQQQQQQQHLSSQQQQQQQQQQPRGGGEIMTAIMAWKIKGCSALPFFFVTWEGRWCGIFFPVHPLE